MSREPVGRGLTPEEFDAFLAMLNPDRELAGQIYEGIRKRLIRLFEWRRCMHPEDLTDETFNRVARKAAEGLKFERDPYAYCCGVAHHVFQEIVRREAREHKAMESGDWSPSYPPEDDEPDWRLDPLRACLQSLEAGQRRLLLRYYDTEQRIQSRKDICKELDIPMNALRIRVHRLRRKVEACVEEKLRNLSMKRFSASGHITTEARREDDFFQDERP